MSSKRMPGVATRPMYMSGPPGTNSHASPPSSSFTRRGARSWNCLGSQRSQIWGGSTTWQSASINRYSRMDSSLGNGGVRKAGSDGPSETHHLSRPNGGVSIAFFGCRLEQRSQRGGVHVLVDPADLRAGQLDHEAGRALDRAAVGCGRAQHVLLHVAARGDLHADVVVAKIRNTPREEPDDLEHLAPVQLAAVDVAPADQVFVIERGDRVDVAGADRGDQAPRDLAGLGFRHARMLSERALCPQRGELRIAETEHLAQHTLGARTERLGGGGGGVGGGGAK